MWDEKKEISCGDLEKQIRNAFPEIGWVSAELTGTRLTVHVRENDGILKAETGSDAPCELTAGSDGTVTKIIVRNGIVRVKAGDEVKTGDVLVSGKLPIYDDSETLVKTNLVHADAEVYAETTRTVTWKIPVVEEIRAGTGKKRKGVFFKFLDTEFCFLMPDLKKGKQLGTFHGRIPAQIFEKFLPSGLRRDPCCQGIYSLRKSPHKSEVSDSADRYLNEYMQKSHRKGIQILG